MNSVSTDLTETEKRVLRKIVMPNLFTGTLQTRLLHFCLKYYAIDLKISFVEIYDVVASLCEKGHLVPEPDITSGMTYRIV